MNIFFIYFYALGLISINPDLMTKQLSGKVLRDNFGGEGGIQANLVLITIYIGIWGGEGVLYY